MKCTFCVLAGGSPFCVRACVTGARWPHASSSYGTPSKGSFVRITHETDHGHMFSPQRRCSAEATERPQHLTQPFACLSLLVQCNARKNVCTCPPTDPSNASSRAPCALRAVNYMRKSLIPRIFSWSCSELCVGVTEEMVVVVVLFAPTH